MRKIRRLQPLGHFLFTAMICFTAAVPSTVFADSASDAALVDEWLNSNFPIQAVTPKECKPAPVDFVYRPSDPVCKGKATVFLYNKLKKSFSLQMRLADGTDRDPARPDCEENSCSPFKCQPSGLRRTKERSICCFGQAGSKKKMQKGKFFTLKRYNTDKNPPQYCLESAALPIN